MMFLTSKIKSVYGLSAKNAGTNSQSDGFFTDSFFSSVAADTAHAAKIKLSHRPQFGRENNSKGA